MITWRGSTPSSSEEVELLQRQLTPVGRVRRDGRAGLQMRPGDRPKDALLRRRDELPLGADLTDDARANPGAIDTLRDLRDKHRRELVGVLFLDVCRIHALPVPAAAHHDLHTRSLRYAPERQRVASQSDVGDIDDGGAARRAIRLHLVDDEIDVVDDQRVVWHWPHVPGVDDEVLVDHADAELLWGDGAEHRSDLADRLFLTHPYLPHLTPNTYRIVL